MSEMAFRTLDPTSEELLDTFPFATPAAVDEALEASEAAFRSWRQSTWDQRSHLLNALADALDAQAPDLAGLMALEMGKPLAEGEAEARKCAWLCRHTAATARESLCPEPATSDGSHAEIRFEPLGPLLAIMPWNFPFWQAIRHTAIAFAAGNTVLFKPAPGTPRCGLALDTLLAETTAVCGAPEGLFETLFLSTAQAAEVIAHPAIRGISLTGSTRAGRAVAALAGRSLKPMVLELGGSDPFIVLDDADIERAAEVGVAARCLNSGQSCIAAKRFVVEKGVSDAFREAFTRRMGEQTWGDPRNPSTRVGPLARADLRDALHDQVERARSAGGHTLCGGEIPDAKGFFYPPTVIIDVPRRAPIAREELFGPVALVFEVENEDDAVALANDTSYGLGASVWTGDRDRAERLIPRLDAGSVFVNGLVKSDPRLPFGGVRDSGFGREMAREGLRELTNRKTVWIA